MALSDIFTPSFAFYLAICLLFTGLLGIYFTQKISEQNHKMNSMLELVSTLANEVNMMRMHLSRPMMMGGAGHHQHSDHPIELNTTSMQQENSMQDLNNINRLIFNNGSLITVSDGDDDDASDDASDDDESDDDASDDDESDDDASDDDDSSDSGSDDDSVESGDETNTNDKNKIKIVELIEENSIQEFNIQDIDVNGNENDGGDEIDINDINDTIDDIKILNFDELCIEDDDNTDNSDVKNIEVVLDYKKATLQKLKNIVVEKNLVKDMNSASKLKKHELLKLLENYI